MWGNVRARAAHQRGPHQEVHAVRKAGGSPADHQWQLHPEGRRLVLRRLRKQQLGEKLEFQRVELQQQRVELHQLEHERFVVLDALAKDREQGLRGRVSTTLLLHPDSNRGEVAADDRTLAIREVDGDPSWEAVRDCGYPPDAELAVLNAHARRDPDLEYIVGFGSVDVAP
jgi:hypothetical protein